jgi:hypothetical protein
LNCSKIHAADCTADGWGNRLLGDGTCGQQLLMAMAIWPRQIVKPDRRKKGLQIVSQLVTHVP